MSYLDSKRLMVLSLSGFLLFFFNPLLFLFFIILLFSELKKSKVFLSIYMVFLFAFINYNKEFISDYVWYFEHYTYWSTGSFDFPFNYSFHNVYARYSEPVYHSLSFILSRLTSGSKFAYNLFFTFLIYMPIIVSVFLLEKRCVWSSRVTFCLLIAIFLLCINPVMVTQLIRQNIAASFLLLSFILFYCKHSKLALIFLLVSILTHTSVIIPAVIVIGAFITFRYEFIKNQKLYFIFFVIAIGYYLPFYLSQSGTYDVLSKSDGELSFIVYLYDIALFALSFFIINKDPKSEYRIFIFVSSTLFLFVLSTFSSDLLLLRYYHFYDYFRILNFMIITPYLFNKITAKVTLLIYFSIGLVFVQLRFAKSPFDFGGDLIDYVIKCYVCAI